jgi:exonuclease III
MDKFRILFWNCNGVAGKTQELQEFITTQKIGIILLGETHIQPYQAISHTHQTVYQYQTVDHWAQQLFSSNVKSLIGTLLYYRY